jgi:toxin ParE1/3/4
MVYKIKISSIAKANVLESLAFYRKNTTKKVVSNFISDYEQSLEIIKQNPFFKIYYKDFRGLPLKKFPFIIFYQINENKKTIFIKAVFHTSQNTLKYPI